MNILKKHAFLPALVLAVVIIALLAFDTYTRKDYGTFYVHDLLGDRSDLAATRIGGELRDGYHRVRFTIEDGQVSAHAELFDQPVVSVSSRYVPGRAKKIDGKDYEVYGNRTFEIVAREPSGIPAGNATVNPGIRYPSSVEGSEQQFTYSNALEYGLAKIGDSVYFTVPSTTESTGFSAIYKLKFSEWGFPAGEDNNSQELVQIDLQANAANRRSSLAILGLEAVGDKLALLAVVDGHLKIIGYDSESGRLWGEMELPDFRMAGSKPDQAWAGSHREAYEAFSDSDGHVLNISFGISGQPGRQSLLSIDFAEGVKVIDRVETDYSGFEEDDFSGITAMKHKDGKLYVVKTLRDTEREGDRYLYNIVRPKHFFIYMYKDSKLIYNGELVTDLNDDNIKAANLSPANGGFGYDQSEYRYFERIRIE